MAIDLNADIGEGLDAVDAQLIGSISSANIACGGHAGDAASMARTVALALEHTVAIGAHPAYPDREGFGRRPMEMPVAALRASLARQVEALATIVEAQGGRMRHLKPHGAIYNQAAVDPEVAAIIGEVARAHDPGLIVVGLAGSVGLDAVRALGMTVAAEGFADRAYEPDGQLRSRALDGAVHDDPGVVAAQALAIARDGRVRTADGVALAIRADTLCLHGDTPGAVEHAVAVRRALVAAGVVIEPLPAST